MKTPCTVLIADDSVTMRNALTALLTDEGFEVVGQAADGQQAVELAASLKPDVITMDVQMPRLDGMNAIAAIMEQSPARILVICSVAAGSQVSLSFQAIQAGALEVIAKQSTRGAEGLRKWGAYVAESIRLMAEVPVVTRRARRVVAPPPQQMIPELVRSSESSIDVLVFASSIGGPNALVFLLKQLAPVCRVPVLIAQHLPSGFSNGLAQWLTWETGMPVKVVAQSEPLHSGHVYLAKDGDLVVRTAGIAQCVPSENGNSPSADRLLDSVALSYGRRAVAAVLTGMGEDGAKGLLAVRNAGGVTLAQDESTCTVFGMPQAAIQAGAVEHVATLPELARALGALLTAESVPPRALAAKEPRT